MSVSVKEGNFIQEIFTVQPDSINSAQAVFDAFEIGKCEKTPHVEEFIKKATYGPSDYKFDVIITTPGSLDFKKGGSRSEIFEFAKNKYGLGLFSDQEVFRIRCFFKEIILGQIFFAATEPVIYKGRPHIYLLERFVIGRERHLSNVESKDRRFTARNQIMFKCL